MKKVVISLLLLCGSAFAAKPLKWTCRSAYIDPIFYRATLQGPDKNQFYKLKFAYKYFGTQLNYQYDVKRIKNSFIGQKARVYNLVTQKNKSVRLYIETEKDGPIDMICRP